MVHQLQISVLAENTARNRGLLAEHGLALWIEADGRKILFDTGQGLVLHHNAEALGIALADADSIVLSHGHYDHADGLMTHPECFTRARVYVHPATFQARYSKPADEQARPAGASISQIDELRPHVADVILTSAPTQIAEGIWVTGEIPRNNSFEDTGGPFYLDEAGTIVDLLPDDQAVYIKTRHGIVVLLGCGHSGLVNTLDYVARLTGQSKMYAVLGGMHLLAASDDHIARTITALRNYGVRFCGPVHCTGLRAMSAMLNAWPDGFLSLSPGSVLVFD